MFYMLRGVLLQAGAGSQTVATTSILSFKLFLKFANAWIVWKTRRITHNIFFKNYFLYLYKYEYPAERNTLLTVCSKFS